MSDVWGVEVEENFFEELPFENFNNMASGNRIKSFKRQRSVLEVLRNKWLAWFLEDEYQFLVAWIHLFSSGNTPEEVCFKQTYYPFQIAGIVKQ